MSTVASPFTRLLGLRAAARFGISHEAARTVLPADGRAGLLSDAVRRRQLAALTPVPPPPPANIPCEHHAEVQSLCERHTQAEVAALFGVSQTTIWRIVHGRRH